MNRKGIFVLIGVFVLGMIAGSGLGLLIGRNAADVESQSRIAQLESQVATATDNYTLMVREYNRLYGLKAGSLVSASVAAVSPATAPISAAAAVAPASTPDAAPTPAQPAAEAPAEAMAAPAEGTAAEATAAPTGAAETAAIAADFKAQALNGTGDLEGPPPQPFQFTDLSIGEITSWKWEFGDGETSEEQNPKHTISACPMDLCTVTLTVCGPAGCDTETKDEYLWVSEQCTGC